MTTPWTEIENTLCAAYECQAAGYAKALSLADEMLANWQPGQDVVERVQAIAVVVAEVAGGESGIAQARQQWVQSGRQPGPKLATALRVVTRLIQELADRIRALESLALAHKNAIEPQLDDLLRGRKMQRAYATGARG